MMSTSPAAGVPQPPSGASVPKSAPSRDWGNTVFTIATGIIACFFFSHLLVDDELAKLREERKKFEVTQVVNLRSHQALAELTLANLALWGDRNPRQAIDHTDRALAQLKEAKDGAENIEPVLSSLKTLEVVVLTTRGAAAQANSDTPLLGTTGQALCDLEPENPDGNYFRALEEFDQHGRYPTPSSRERCRRLFSLAAGSERKRNDAVLYLAMLDLEAGKFLSAVALANEYSDGFGNDDDKQRLGDRKQILLQIADGIVEVGKFLETPGRYDSFPALACAPAYLALNRFEGEAMSELLLRVAKVVGEEGGTARVGGSGESPPAYVGAEIYLRELVARIKLMSNCGSSSPTYAEPYTGQPMKTDPLILDKVPMEPPPMPAAPQHKAKPSVPDSHDVPKRDNSRRHK